MHDEEEFSISTEHRDGCLVVVVRGELDELNAFPLDETLTDSELPIIVDLSAVTFVCSASLRVLLRERAGGRPALVAPTRTVAKVLDIVQAGRTNRVFPDRASALESARLGRLQATG